MLNQPQRVRHKWSGGWAAAKAALPNNGGIDHAVCIDVCVAGDDFTVAVPGCRRARVWIDARADRFQFSQRQRMHVLGPE